MVREQMPPSRDVQAAEWWQDVKLPMLQAVRRHLRDLVRFHQEGRRRRRRRQDASSSAAARWRWWLPKRASVTAASMQADVSESAGAKVERPRSADRQQSSSQPVASRTRAADAGQTASRAAAACSSVSTSSRWMAATGAPSDRPGLAHRLASCTRCSAASQCGTQDSGPGSPRGTRSCRPEDSAPCADGAARRGR